jgi:hypothetical protein
MYMYMSCMYGTCKCTCICIGIIYSPHIMVQFLFWHTYLTCTNCIHAHVHAIMRMDTIMEFSSSNYSMIMIQGLV